jgi:hypothetical protein
MGAHEIARTIDQELQSAIGQADTVADKLDSLTDSFVKFKVAGAPKVAIMEALGISEDEFDRLNAKQEVKQAVLVSETQRLETGAIMDSGWDVIENQAMAIVLEAVREARDPEFSLRAAAVANKAIRRRREDAKLLAQTQPGEYKNVNNIAVINLPKMFVNSLQTQTQADISKQLELQTEAVEIPKFTDVADVCTTNQLLSSEMAVKNARQICSGLETKEQIDDFIGSMLDGKF